MLLVVVVVAHVSFTVLLGQAVGLPDAKLTKVMKQKNQHDQQKFSIIIVYHKR